MNRRTALTLLAAAPIVGCAALPADVAKVSAAAGKIALTIQTDAPTVLAGITSALGVASQVLDAVGTATPVGATISAIAAVATPVVKRIEAAIAANTAPVTSDLAVATSATSALLAAVVGTWKATATAAG